MEIKAELNFPGNLKNEPIICDICKKFDFTLIIVEASFSTDVGWAILIFQGEEEILNTVFEYLRGKGVKIENIQKS